MGHTRSAAFLAQHLSQWRCPSHDVLMLYAPFWMRYEGSDISLEAMPIRLCLRARQNQSTSTSVKSDAMAHARESISTAESIQFVKSKWEIRHTSAFLLQWQRHASTNAGTSIHTRSRSQSRHVPNLDILGEEHASGTELELVEWKELYSLSNDRVLAVEESAGGQTAAAHR